MPARPSLGVVIPTRESAGLLPAHIAGLNGWIARADQVVVVDSHSKDATRDILARDLKHPKVQILSHPPGLYASWNAAIRQLTTEFAYIATVGETITKPGIEQLLQAAACLRADVVISKPVFIRTDGTKAGRHWPIDDILQTLNLRQPRLLQRLEALIFAATNVSAALTGSCASDLFRTATLRAFPFPTEFGTAGDGIWGLLHAAEVAWAVVPGSFSTFLLHCTRASQRGNRPGAELPRADVVLGQAVAGWTKHGILDEGDLAIIGWPTLKSALTDYLNSKATFDRQRKAAWPWILNPWSWKTRRERSTALEQLLAAKTQALAALANSAPCDALLPECLAQGDGACT
jgi:glycosyltransferase involved in cell wall biosynthesis